MVFVLVRAKTVQVLSQAKTSHSYSAKLSYKFYHSCCLAVAAFMTVFTDSPITTQMAECYLPAQALFSNGDFLALIILVRTRLSRVSLPLWGYVSLQCAVQKAESILKVWLMLISSSLFESLQAVHQKKGGGERNDLHLWSGSLDENVEE